MTAVTIRRSRREVARRVSGGIEIALFWRANENTTSVATSHCASEKTMVGFTVAREHALDAFYHSFAHLLDAAPVEGA